MFFVFFFLSLLIELIGCWREMGAVGGEVGPFMNQAGRQGLRGRRCCPACLGWLSQPLDLALNLSPRRRRRVPSAVYLGARSTRRWRLRGFRNFTDPWFVCVLVTWPARPRGTIPARRNNTHKRIWSRHRRTAPRHRHKVKQTNPYYFQ